MKDTISTEELINLISDVLLVSEPEFVKHIAKKVLVEQVTYIGNDVWEIIN